MNTETNTDTDTLDEETELVETYPDELKNLSKIKLSITKNPFYDSNRNADTLYDLHGDILIDGDSDEMHIGTVKGKLINLSANGICMDSLVDIADSVDQEMYDAFAAIYGAIANEDEDVNEDMFDEASIHHVLYLSMMEIDEKYRGKGIGHKIMIDIEDIFTAYTCVTVIHPCPKTISHSYAKNELKSAKSKLQKYWAKNGFQRVAKTEYYVKFGYLKQPYDE